MALLEHGGRKAHQTVSSHQIIPSNHSDQTKNDAVRAKRAAGGVFRGDVSFGYGAGNILDGEFYGKVPGGQKTAAPKAPEKDGYDFDGWYLDDTAYDFEAPVNENLTLTAHWKLKSETPAQEPKTDNPKAGDAANFALWIALAVFGGMGAVTAAAWEKKARRVK